MKIFTLERQIEILARYGILLNPGIVAEDLLSAEYSRSSFESRPFEGLLYRYDHTFERDGANLRFCDRVAYLDAGYFEGLDGYLILLEILNRVTGYVLELSEWRVDLLPPETDEGQSILRLSGLVAGREAVFNYEPRNYVDLDGVIRDLNGLLEASGFSERVMQICDNGQAGLFALLQPEQVVPFLAETGLRSRRQLQDFAQLGG